MKFIFTYKDQKYSYDDAIMSLGEARWIKQNTGLVGARFFEAARNLDPDAILALLVLAKRRAGDTDFSIDDFDMDEADGYIKLIEGMDVAESTEAKPKSLNRAARRKTPVVED